MNTNTAVRSTELHREILAWYAANARELPWREPEAGAWAVMVSEFMLQQTPVKRVLPRYAAWMERWPTPAALAADPPGEAVRAWERLGYPRRALRLHAAATAIVERHGGSAASAAGVGQRRIQSAYLGSTRFTGVCWSMNSLTITAQAPASGSRQGSSRAFTAYQARISRCRVSWRRAVPGAAVLVFIALSMVAHPRSQWDNRNG